MTPSFIQLDKPAIWGPPLLSAPIISHYQWLISFNLLNRFQIYTVLPTTTITAVEKLWWSFTCAMDSKLIYTFLFPCDLASFPSLLHIKSVCLFQIFSDFPLLLGWHEIFLTWATKLLTIWPLNTSLSCLLQSSPWLSLSVTMTFFISQDVIS